MAWDSQQPGLLWRAVGAAGAAAWAVVLLVTGLWLLGAVRPWDGAGYRVIVGSAVFLVAAGEFVMMVGVADTLCPRAPAAATGTLKAIAAAAVVGSVAYLAWVWLCQRGVWLCGSG